MADTTKIYENIFIKKNAAGDREYIKVPYAILADPPTIPDVSGFALTSDIHDGILTIQQNGTNVATFGANQSTNATANITVPTKTSELTNDSGFLTSHQDVSGLMPKSGGEFTGGISAPNISTGTDAANYFQTQRFRGEGNADTYYHAVDFGFAGHNQVDFHEYGGLYNFYQNTTGAPDSGSLVGAFTPDGIKEGNQLLKDKYLDKSGGTVTGDLTVGGNLTINGTTTTVDSTTLQVKDKLIEVAHGNTAALTTPAGLVAPKYDGTNSGALVFDSTGTAYVGDVTLKDGNIDVTNSGLQPLATRTGLVGGNLVQYDSTAQTLKDSGKKISDLATTSQVNAKYTKPNGGIPKSDLASSVQTSLGKADTALQSAPVTSVNGKTGSVNLGAGDVGALPSSTKFVSSVNGSTGAITGIATKDEVNAKQNKLTETQLAAVNSGVTKAKREKYDGYEATINQKANSADLATVATSGSYNDLNDKPTNYVTTNTTQTISGSKTFTGEVKFGSTENFQGYYIKRMIGSLSAGTEYKNLDASYKDGTWHRMWRLRFPSGKSFWGKIKITLYGGYSSFNASGVMSKSITCNFNTSNIYNNVGCYDGLGVNVEQDFRISEAIWNATVSAWEVLIWQKNLNGNNSPTIMLECWTTNNTNYIKAFNGITAQTVELTQSTSYSAQKASPTGGTKTVTWATLPVYENPLGEEIATLSDLPTYSLSGTTLTITL